MLGLKVLYVNMQAQVSCSIEVEEGSRSWRKCLSCRRPGASGVGSAGPWAWGGRGAGGHCRSLNGVLTKCK